MDDSSNQNELRARFCQALSDMYKNEVPLYGDLIDVVWEADAKAVQADNAPTINPDDILPTRHRVERHGAIRLGTTAELRTIRRLFAVLGMYPVGYYSPASQCTRLRSGPKHPTPSPSTPSESSQQFYEWSC